MKISEKQLIARFRKGDKAAFGGLVTEYRDRVLSLAFDLSGNYADAQDIAQEVFVKAYKNMAWYQEKSAFYTWLYRITVNQSRDHFRRRRDTVPYEEIPVSASLPMEMLPAAERTLDNEKMHRSIRHALTHLTENQRAAVILTYFHGLSSAEAGEVMGISANTVRTHLLRALSRLRPLLEEIKELVHE
ncbi:RNA polymerase sigma factor [bacterium]|nr:RNA polymerase sigma factor [bacterium]